MADTSNKIRQRGQNKVLDQLKRVFYGDQDRYKKDSEKRWEEIQDGYQKVSPALTLQNVLWFIGSMFVIYFSDFFLAILYDTRVKRTWLHIGVFLVSVTLSIAAYLILWVSTIKKLTPDAWEKRYPGLIPIATFSFVVGAICLVVALWPVWSWFTPFIMFVIFMGLVVFISWLPGQKAYTLKQSQELTAEKRQKSHKKPD